MDRKEITSLLAAAGLHPQHRHGQNFMVDQAALRAIVDAGEVKPGDVVLEIGPGVGNLTRLLSRAASGGDEGPRGAVLAVDIDAELMAAAKAHHRELQNVTWLHADALASKHRVEPRVIEALRALRAEHAGGSLKLVSNLPYNAASPLVAELLVEMWREVTGATTEVSGASAAALHFSRLAFTVQWEVGQRMMASADTRDYGPLGILLQAMADVRITRKIAAGAFWPPPKIQSALVVVMPDIKRIAKIEDAPALQKFLAGIFSHRRQTLGNALRHFLGDSWNPEFKKTLSAAGFDLLRRPENYPVNELLRLERVTHALQNP